MKCKHCGSEVTRKNGFVRSVQRYQCAACGLNFIEGDRRRKPQTAVKEAMEATPEPTIASDVQEMEFDEMWHFLKKKSKIIDHQSAGSSHTANDCLGYRES